MENAPDQRGSASSGLDDRTITRPPSRDGLAKLGGQARVQRVPEHGPPRRGGPPLPHGGRARASGLLSATAPPSRQHREPGAEGAASRAALSPTVPAAPSCSAVPS